ncbi:methionine--tRNA ligase [Polycyclovorans algicola]|uniref:methionine--tRNA ligase n=1 Tax=Polycyclovorans algicola TaxID=616992 RepID=UPI001F245AFE|nr:methionine--tRNA ligase [Polycyclovorans algicola]
MHLGHLVGYVQADIWVRFQRLCRHEVHYVCADDAHGTPIMLAAEKAGLAPEDFIDSVRKRHMADFADFGVEFDHYHSTHSPENERLSQLIYTRLRDAGHIAQRNVRQLYDPERQMFLPDRFIKGECPKCSAADQYGDNCEVCGAAYAPTDLKNPRSVVSGAAPELRDSEHYFFKLNDFKDFVTDYLQESLPEAPVSGTESWRPRLAAHKSMLAKLKEWLDAGLRDWDISRDAPYFGFAIPDAPGKYFYVWLDAPIGYMASFAAHAAKLGKPELFDEYWGAPHPSPLTPHEIHHFIGKDIVNFHGLFWPAMLKGAGFRTPTQLHVNGYLTINGQKMSKSRGTFIQARTWLGHLPPEALRYYFAAKLGSGPEDLDLSLDDFAARVNSDLVGKYVNIASRCAGFIEKQFDSKLSRELFQTPESIHALVLDYGDEIKARYESGELSTVVRSVMWLADKANAELQKLAPWKRIKEEGSRNEVHEICSTFINVFRLLTLYLKPILPQLAKQAEAFLNIPPLNWADAATPLLDHAINPYQPLMTRIEKAQTDALLAAEAGNSPSPAGGRGVGERAAPERGAPSQLPAAVPATPSPPTPLPISGEGSQTISIDDFIKVDLRVARIAEAGAVEGADKLLRLQLDLGPLGTRQVFAGIKKAYDPALLVGKLTVCVANLAPRKMKFGMSEGMVLAASNDSAGPCLLWPDEGAEPGMRIK